MIRTTLVTDGSSDRVLIRMLEWSLREAGVRAELLSQWADLRQLKAKPVGLSQIIRTAIELYPCNLLFVHRDAEKASPQARVDEIHSAVGAVNVPYIPIVPVRMQESWLLCDERAIRAAAGNPNGKVSLQMPQIARIERIAEPKELVFDLLRTASERTGRKLQQFNVEFARSLICEQIKDFSTLRALNSFVDFERCVAHVVREHRFDKWA